MLKSIPELIAPAAAPSSPEKRAPLWYGLLKWAAVIVACLWLANAGISLLIRHTTLKRHLTARLEAAFGRPVQVGKYGFSLWTGPQLEAYSVRVGEDPRFGNEYFLRADSIALRIRVSGLLLGHLELGTISLSHPSLNLVRNADGDWNLAEWLPRPQERGARGTGSNRPAAKPAAPRVYKIEVDSGRINFKRGDEKLPFAFVDVNGTAETEGPGRWRLDLVAAPERAAAIVQDPGVLHLAGHLGGTSSRLRPALLRIDWSGASIQDVLRLTTENDLGVRGILDVSLVARTNGDAWTLTGDARASQLHRWDLPLRADNPSVVLAASGRLDPSGSRVELTSGKIEMAHSSASVTGALDWTHPGQEFADLFAAPLTASNRNSRLRRANAAKDGTELHIVSNGISLSDVLAWARAFHPGISDDVALGGFATAEADLRGWPPRVLSARFALDRGGMVGTGMPSVRLSSIAIRYDRREGMTLAPATVTIGRPANSFRVEGSAKLDGGPFFLRARGSTTDVRAVIGTAGKLGWNLARGWKIAGPARCDLRWERTRLEDHTNLVGSVQWGTASDGVSIGAPFLNRPVEGIRAAAELQPGSTRIVLTSARAFGTRWTGTLQHELSDGWKFSLSGNSLSAAELDRWLDPRWRQSFLDRMLPFLNSSAAATAAVETVRARGNISLDEFTLAPVAIHRLRGEIAIDGRRVELANASGQFDRGQVGGSLKATFDGPARYDAAIDFSDVDLKALSNQFPSLAGEFTGTGSAKMRFSMRGTTRSDLMNSLECRGTAVASGLSVAKIALSGPERDIAAPARLDDPTVFPEASAAFSCGKGKIDFRDLALGGSDAAWNGGGSVDFARNLDLRLRLVPADTVQPRSAEPGSRKVSIRAGAQEAEYRIGGTLADPRIARLPLAVRASPSKR